MNTRLVRFTKWLLDVMFYGGFGVTLGIPVIFRYVGKYMESFRIHYIPQCILYIGSGILCLLIVLELRKMFDTVLADRAFVMENADSLKRIGKLSFFLAALSLVRLPLATTPATAVVIIELNHMLHRLCGPPSIHLSFNLAAVLPRRST